MSSVTERGRGFLIQFRLATVRKTISFSNRFYTRADVEEIARYIDKCIDAMVMETTPDRKTLAWLSGIPKELRDKLANAGLIEIEKSLKLNELLDEYYFSDEFFGLKPTSQSSKTSAKKRLLAFFNGDIVVENISKNDVRAFAEYLSKNYSEATRAGTIRDIRRVFNFGIERELIKENPFNGIPRGSFKNKKREYYISMEQYELMLAECRTQILRTLLALYRIGGLRKEEAMLLVWDDVDFENGKLKVHSPKTERYKGREERIIPLFPKLKQELESLYKEKTESPFVISTTRGTVFKRLEEIVRAARLPRWERLIQNLRSSRAIEIYRDYGVIAEAEWIGHTEKTARDHYLHLLDVDFEKALKE